MELIKIQKLLYQAFDFFNKELVKGELPTPLITILSRGTKKRVLGWMWKEKWKIGDELQHEIMLSAETLDRTFEEAMETLLHEMAHLYNVHANLKDVNPAGRHNKKFKKTAEDIFKLSVAADKKLGWAHTGLTDVSSELIKRFKEIAIVTEWKLRRLDPIKLPVPKVYTMQVSMEHKEWLKDLAEEKEMKSKDLLFEILEKCRETGYNSMIENKNE